MADTSMAVKTLPGEAVQVKGPSGDTIPVSIGPSFTPQTPKFQAGSAIASGAAAQWAITVPDGSTSITITSLRASSRGEMKVDVSVGPTGSEVQIDQGFTGKGDNTYELVFDPPLVIPSGSDLLFNRTNLETSTQDLPASVQWGI